MIRPYAGKALAPNDFIILDQNYKVLRFHIVQSDNNYYPYYIKDHTNEICFRISYALTHEYITLDDLPDRVYPTKPDYDKAFKPVRRTSKAEYLGIVWYIVVGLIVIIGLIRQYVYKGAY